MIYNLANGTLEGTPALIVVKNVEYNGTTKCIPLAYLRYTNDDEHTEKLTFAKNLLSTLRHRNKIYGRPCADANLTDEQLVSKFCANFRRRKAEQEADQARNKAREEAIAKEKAEKEATIKGKKPLEFMTTGGQPFRVFFDVPDKLTGKLFMHQMEPQEIKLTDAEKRFILAARQRAEEKRAQAECFGRLLHAFSIL